MPPTEIEKEISLSALNQIFSQYEAKIQKELFSKYIFPSSFSLSTLIDADRQKPKSPSSNGTNKNNNLFKFDKMKSKQTKNKMKEKLMRLYSPNNSKCLLIN